MSNLNIMRLMGDLIKYCSLLFILNFANKLSIFDAVKENDINYDITFYCRSIIDLFDSDNE